MSTRARESFVLIARGGGLTAMKGDIRHGVHGLYDSCAGKVQGLWVPGVHGPPSRYGTSFS